MSERIMILVEANVTPEVFQDCRTLGSQLATTLGEEVDLALLPKTRMQLIRAALRAAGGDRYVEPIPPAEAAPPMGSAPFLWREDGRPDWERMWSGFCELALFGGPPHRGTDSALTATPLPADEPDSDWDAIAEIVRGIRETTGLVAEPAGPGWLAVRCASATVAAWLCATIILENVEARCEGDRLYLPASPGFALKDQVKSVITVLAKTYHYWSLHAARTPAATP